MSRLLRWTMSFLLLAVAANQSAAAAELVMFESPDCAWCRAWNDEIGGIYALTDEAQIAPLRRVDIHGDRPPDLAKIRPIMFTPTFVLMDDGVEVGRILGYPGEAFFWGLLQMELAKLPDHSVTLTRLAGPGEATETQKGE